MIKIVLILGLVALSIQHKHQLTCYDLDVKDCNKAVSCRFDDVSKICQIAEYEPLGHKRDTFAQRIIFNHEEECNEVINYGDFKGTQTFRNSREFKSWCNSNSIHKIRIDGIEFYGNGVLPTGKEASSAIIYPKVEDGCALLFAKKFYRGKSWNVCRPTKLNGQNIRSIMLGDDARLSLYTREGEPMWRYQQLVFNNQDSTQLNDEGIPRVRGYEHVEYVLVEQVRLGA